MRKYYYLGILNTRSFKEKPFLTLYRGICLFFIDLFKLKLKFKIKHENINFKFWYLPSLSKRSGGGAFIYIEKKSKI